MFLLIVAAQLAASDLLDLRCVYVFETVAHAATGEDRDAAKWVQQWFEGRLSARQPQLNVHGYISEHFGSEQASSGDAYMEQCSQAYTAWAAEQIAGQLPK